MSDDVVRRHFDGVAPEYESNRLGPWYIAHGAFIAERLAGRRFDLALDVGCGTGWLLRKLVRRGIAERGIGVDLSQRMCEQATRRAAEEGVAGLQFHPCEWPHVSSALEARLLDDRPDLAVFASSLHYADDPEAWLGAAAGVLAPGGLVAVLERAPERSVATRAWGALHASFLRDGASFFTTERVSAALAAAGCVDVRTAGYLRRWFWRGKLITSMALTTGRVPG